MCEIFLFLEVWIQCKTLVKPFQIFHSKNTSDVLITHLLWLWIYILFFNKYLYLLIIFSIKGNIYSQLFYILIVSLVSWCIKVWYLQDKFCHVILCVHLHSSSVAFYVCSKMSKMLKLIDDRIVLIVWITVYVLY